MTGRRGTLVLGAVLAAAAIVAVLIALSARGGDAGGSPGDLAGVSEVTAEIRGIPQAGATIGRADAPVEITEYADPQCPFCGDAAREVVPEVIRKYVRPGKARLRFRVLAFIGPDSERGARAIVAAGRQNRLWDFAGVLYRNQGGENAGWLTDALVRSMASAVGADPERVESDAKSADAGTAIAEDAAAARADGVESTPTFVVKGPGGTQYVRGAAGIAAFDTAIEAAAR